MKNRIIAIILVCASAFCLCGCQLALPDGGEMQRDRLIGCFITTEQLELFDYEAYLNDNADRLLGGGEVMLDGDTSAYYGRIYAEYYEETYTDDEGVSHTIGSYRFPNEEGICFIAPTLFEKDGRDYVHLQTDEGLHEVNQHVKNSDDKSYCTELSAKVYAAVDEEAGYTGDETIFYMNRVYQSDDGRVYLTGTDGGFAANCTMPDTLMTTTINEERSETVNGEETTAGCSVSIAFATTYAAESVTVTELSADAEVLESAVFAAEKLPESYDVREDTAYILLTVISPDGHTERSIVAPDTEDKDITALIESENGWLESVYCEVLWKERA